MDSFRVLAIASDFKKNYIISFDFPQYYNRKCTPDDYVQYSHKYKTENCFSGVEYILKRRKANTLCIRDTDYADKIEKIECSCTAEDFGCSWGHHKVNGKCIEDPDIQPSNIDNIKECENGKLISNINERIANVKIGECKLTNLQPTYEIEISGMKQICLNQNISEIIVVCNSQFLKFYSIPSIVDNQLPLIFEYNISQHSITNFAFDWNSKTIYSVIDGKIYSYSYRLEESDILTFKWSLVSFNQTIQSIDIDFIGKNLYYINNFSFVGIFNIKTSNFRTIWSAEPVESIKLYPSDGILLMKLVNSSLFLLEMDGMYNIKIVDQYVSDFVYDLERQGVFYSTNHNNKINFVSIAQYKTQQILNSVELFTFYSINLMIEVYQSYILTYSPEIIILYEKNFTNNHILEVKVPNIYNIKIVNIKKRSITKCDLSNCSFICVNLPQTSSCLCQEGCEYRSGNCDCQKSILKDMNNNISKHEEVEKETNESDSTLQHKRSNGNFINKSKLCDGINDCSDGSDENCTKLIKCTSTQFDCHDNKCIDKSLVCDNKLDCMNGLDEYKCHDQKCSINHIACMDKTCISKNSLCDGVKNCIDGEDENKLFCDFCITTCDDGGICFKSNKYCDKVLEYDEITDILQKISYGKTHFSIIFLIIICICIIYFIIRNTSLSISIRNKLLLYKLYLINILSTNSNYQQNDQVHDELSNNTNSFNNSFTSFSDIY